MMSIVIEANKSQTLRNRRKKRRRVIESDIRTSDIVDIIVEKEGSDDKG